MKQYISLLLLLGVTVLFSCKKEQAPDASSPVQDPFVRVDNPANEADHQIYLFYKETGMPLLYSDTLTKDPLNILKVGYQIITYDSTLRISYLQSSADVLEGINFVKNEIYPALGAGIKPYSILLADSAIGRVVATINGVRQLVDLVYNAYPSLSTLVISKISAIKNMAPDTLTYYKKDIFKNILQIPLTQDPDVLKAFNAVSAAYYNKYAYGTENTNLYVPYVPMEVYGLVSLLPTPPFSYSIGSQGDDLNGYLDVVLSRTREQFAAQYGNYPLVMNKYDLLMQAFVKLGFKMPK